MDGLRLLTWHDFKMVCKHRDWDTLDCRKPNKECSENKCTLWCCYGKPMPVSSEIVGGLKQDPRPKMSATKLRKGRRKRR